MDKKYGLYGFVGIVGAVVVLWAGLSPFFLLLLVACPLMMFLMMGGMGGKGGKGAGTGDSKASEDVTRVAAGGRETRVDGDQDRHHH